MSGHLPQASCKGSNDHTERSQHLSSLLFFIASIVNVQLLPKRCTLESTCPFATRGLGSTRGQQCTSTRGCCLLVASACAKRFPSTLSHTRPPPQQDAILKACKHHVVGQSFYWTSAPGAATKPACHFHHCRRHAPKRLLAHNPRSLLHTQYACGGQPTHFLHQAKDQSTPSRSYRVERYASPARICAKAC